MANSDSIKIIDTLIQCRVAEKDNDYKQRRYDRFCSGAGKHGKAIATDLGLKWALDGSSIVVTSQVGVSFRDDGNGVGNFGGYYGFSVNGVVKHPDMTNNIDNFLQILKLCLKEPE